MYLDTIQNGEITSSEREYFMGLILKQVIPSVEEATMRPMESKTKELSLLFFDRMLMIKKIQKDSLNLIALVSLFLAIKVRKTY
jgi:hypothetical protein